MNTSVYSNKIIVFKTDAVNALKAASEIDDLSYVYVLIFENVVTVSINVRAENNSFDRSIEKTMKQITEILKKYNIEYKLKGMKF